MVSTTFSGFFSLFFTISLSCYIAQDSDLAYQMTTYSNDGKYSNLATNGDGQQCHVRPTSMVRPLYYVDLGTPKIASEICVRMSFRYLKGNNTFIRVKGGNFRQYTTNWRILVTKRLESGTYPHLVLNDALPNVTFRFFGIEGGSGSVFLNVCVFSLRGNVNMLERILKNEYFRLFLFCVPLILIVLVIITKRYTNRNKKKKQKQKRIKNKNVSDTASEGSSTARTKIKKQKLKITKEALIEKKKELKTKKPDKSDTKTEVEEESKKVATKTFDKTEPVAKA